MVVTTKKKATAASGPVATSADYEKLIQTSLEQADTLGASVKVELQQIAFSQATISTHQSEIAQRQRDRETIQRQLQGILQTVADARGQVALTAGAAAQSTMDMLLAAESDAQTTQQRLDTMLREHEIADQAAQASIAEHQQSIADREKHVHELENELRVVGEKRQQYLAKLGECLHKAAIQRLSHLTTIAQASEDQHLASKRDLALARREEDQKLARWPGLRQDLAHTYAIGEDATSTALALFAHFLDFLTTEHQAIQYAAAGLPSGVYSILSEFAIDQYHLRAVAAGDPTTLRIQKERVEAIHRDYLAKLVAATHK